MTESGRDLRMSLVQGPCSSRASYSMVMSIQVLSVTKMESPQPFWETCYSVCHPHSEKRRKKKIRLCLNVIV